MRKSFLLALITLLSAAIAEAKGEVKITCQAAPYVVVVVDASVSEPEFQLLQDGQVVGTGKFQRAQEGYESFMDAYVWGFVTAAEDSVLAVGVPGLQTPAPGIYAGKSDLFISSNGHTADGSTLDCEVVIE